MFQNESVILRENVQVKLLWCNHKYLQSKVNIFVDKDKVSVEEWETLSVKWLPNSYQDKEIFVLPVMLTRVLDTYLKSEWHKNINWTIEAHLCIIKIVLRFPSTVQGTFASTWLGFAIGSRINLHSVGQQCVRHVEQQKHIFLASLFL
jgi:hypothetical protein